MEDYTSSEPPPLTEAEITAADVAIAAVSVDEIAAVNGGGGGNDNEGGDEAAIGGINGDLGVAETEVVRKRGRPKKNRVDYDGKLPISPEYLASSISVPQKRGRGRPKGTGKLQKLASLGGLAVDTAGGAFTPHAMTVETGEDIVEFFLSFAQRASRSACVLSATGVVSSVDISQPGGVLRYEGLFEILSLVGSYTYREMGGGVSRKISMLSVSLANPDGRVFGGAVAGSLIAAGRIQVVLASFKQNIKAQLQRRFSSESLTAKDMLGNLYGASNSKTKRVEEIYRSTSHISGCA